MVKEMLLDKAVRKTKDEIYQEYDKHILPGMTDDEILSKLKTLKDDPYYEDYVSISLDNIIFVYCGDFSKYPDKLTDFDEDCRRVYDECLKLIPKDRHFYHAVGAFFRGDRKLFEATIQNYLSETFPLNGDTQMTELDLGSNFLVIYKNAYPMFWSVLGDVLRDYNVKEGIPELCKLLEEFYKADSADEVLPILLDFYAKHQSLVLPKELLASVYYDLKMWGNSLSYLEQVEDKSVYLYPYSVYFMMAYCSGKTRNVKDEEVYYRKSLEAYPNQGLARNNLGYCLYKQHRYEEAKEELEQSLELDGDLRFPANNYVRVLLSMGLNEDAKKFAESSPVKIAKTFLDKIASSDGKNHAYVKDTVVKIDDDVSDNDNAESSEVKSQITFNAKAEQFSSEKLLEDELTARIESGLPAFGMNLRIWKRKGEYGRQYILPTGKRLDLLCEDEKGDLYIIELKKDSGYDDPYDQTAEYVDWFESNSKYKGHKIYGIICLNSPTKSVLNKVHNDKRIRLFEYQVSYVER